MQRECPEAEDDGTAVEADPEIVVEMWLVSKVEEAAADTAVTGPECDK